MATGRIGVSAGSLGTSCADSRNAIECRVWSPTTWFAHRALSNVIVDEPPLTSLIP